MVVLCCFILFILWVLLLYENNIGIGVLFSIGEGGEGRKEEWREEEGNKWV